MQINPFKGTVLPHQILNILELFLIQAGICDKQDAPVDGPGLLKHPPYILFRNTVKAAHFHTAYHHFALFQHKDRVQQQRVAKDLYTFRDSSRLAHHMDVIYDKGRGNQVFYLMDAVISAFVA